MRAPIARPRGPKAHSLKSCELRRETVAVAVHEEQRQDREQEHDEPSAGRGANVFADGDHWRFVDSFDEIRSVLRIGEVIAPPVGERRPHIFEVVEASRHGHSGLARFVKPMHGRLRLAAEKPAGANHRSQKHKADGEGEQRWQRVRQATVAGARAQALVKRPSGDGDDARPAERRQIFGEGPQRQENHGGGESEPRRALPRRFGWRRDDGGLFGHRAPLVRGTPCLVARRRSVQRTPVQVWIGRSAPRIGSRDSTPWRPRSRRNNKLRLRNRSGSKRSKTTGPKQYPSGNPRAACAVHVDTMNIHAHRPAPKAALAFALTSAYGLSRAAREARHGRSFHL